LFLLNSNNKVIEELTPGLGKLMEETASAFWVDLGYRLRSRDTIPLQGSEGWLASHIVHIVIVIDTLLLSHCYCYWLPSGRTWFSARWLGRSSEYVRNPPKVWTMSLQL